MSYSVTNASLRSSSGSMCARVWEGVIFLRKNIVHVYCHKKHNTIPQLRNLRFWQELNLKIEKLNGENSRLTEELREITGDDLPEVTVTSAASPRPQAQPPLKTQSQPQETHPRRSSEVVAEIAIPGETVAEEVTEGATDSNVSEAVGGDDVAEKGEGDPELTGDKAVPSKVASSIVEGGEIAGVGGKKREGVDRELPPEGFVPAEEIETFDFSALQR